jgi:hypothetical protein
MRRVGFDVAGKRAPALFRLLIGAVLVAVLGGCSASIQGAPPRLFPVATELNQVRDVLNLDWYGAYAKASGPDRRYYRDQAVFARMYAIDIAYGQYELALTRERQNVGFLSTLTQLGLTTAGTLVGGEETKTILAATATGVTGAKEAYDKNVLLDVEEYYRAGTITGALIGASEDASTSLVNAEAQERQVFEFRFSRTPVSPRIQQYFLTTSAANQEKVLTWMANNGFKGSLNRFLSTAPVEDQQRMINELGIP